MVNSEKTYSLTSPEFPSGVAWLLNILLELKLEIFRDAQPTFWVGETEKRLHPQQDELKRWLPSLVLHETYQFKDPVRFYWHHGWPVSNPLNMPQVFYARNGMDAVYSHYKRMHPELPYLTYLKRPFRRVQTTTPGLLHLPPAETWALYCLLWKRLASKNTFWLQFEKMKAEPSPEIQRFLQHIGVTRSVEAIEKAIEASSFEKAKVAEEAYLKNHPESSQIRINRSGKANEWQQTIGAKEKSCFNGLPTLALKELGYSTEGLEEKKISWDETTEECIQRLVYQESHPFGPYGKKLDAFSTERVMQTAFLLLSKEWTQDLLPFADEHNEERRRLQTELCYFSLQMEARPLILARMALALKSFGAREQGVKLLKDYLDTSDISFYEAIELGRTYRWLQCIPESIGWFRKAGLLATHQTDSQELARQLIEENVYRGARVFLASAGKKGWLWLITRRFFKRLSKKLKFYPFNVEKRV